MNWWQLGLVYLFLALVWFGAEMEFRHIDRRQTIRLKWVRRMLPWRWLVWLRVRPPWRRCVITARDARWLEGAMGWHHCPDCARSLAKHR